MGNTFKDISGQMFGYLTAIKPTDKRKNKYVVWECLCGFCGKTCFVTTKALRNGKKSCGCFRGKDISGLRFGELVAIRPIAERRNNQIVWECACDCGNTAYVPSGHLIRGSTKSCGQHRYDDLTGKRFGRLTVIAVDPERRNGFVRWKCKCDCGSTISIYGANLKNGATQSCGCLHSERTIAANKTRKKEPSERNKYKRNYPEYKEWRKAVYARDNYICQKCGKTKSHHLVAHHIESYADNKELRTEINNGITLCEECHDNFHHQYGRGNNTREQFDEFLKEGGEQ